MLLDKEGYSVEEMIGLPASAIVENGEYAGALAMVADVTRCAGATTGPKRADLTGTGSSNTSASSAQSVEPHER